MNLINDAWIPIRRKSGAKESIAPWQLTDTDDPVIALNAPRPDFNGALLQFLIGLLQTTATPASHDQWLDWLEKAPQPETLKNHFSQHVDAFELQGENGSFMQDFESLNSCGLSDIAGLLIDSPGDITIKENRDHFVKRGAVQQICPGCAAMAIFALQINAPGGGPGYHTSLRGGGPLTTLVVLDSDSGLPNDLWRNLWLNVLERQQVDTLTGDKTKISPAATFPWLTKTRTSEKGTDPATTPIDVNPLQMYWGMPRRIKVEWQPAERGRGHCDLCNAESGQLVTHYRKKQHGTNYNGAWQHPLSPYPLSKTDDSLPQHAQPGGLTYQHWLGFVEHSETQFSAAVIRRYRVLADDWGEQFRLYAFGYDTYKMKARCWYEATFPLFTIPASIRIDFASRVQTLTETASDFSGFVRSRVKEAWFKRPGDAKGDTSFLRQSFYQHTENAFYQAVKTLQAKIPAGTDKEVLQEWHETLRKAAFDLFDYWAVRGDFTQANPRRIAAARHKLEKNMYSKKIREALQLPAKTKVAA